jgi:pyruvate dehydrogenase E1 component alpha subunit
MTGHSAFDAASYVPQSLFDEWGKLDPIIRLKTRMVQEGWADHAEIEQTHALVRREVDEAVEWAEASPFPDPATLLDDVYES